MATQFIEALTSVTTLKEWETFDLTEAIDFFTSEAATPEDRATFRHRYGELKKQLNPATGNAEIEAAQKAYHETPTEETSKALRDVVIGVGNSADSQLHAKLFGETDRQLSAVWKLDFRGGRSNRARGAVTASSVFSRHAGLTTIPGAEVDQHGNAVGLNNGLVPEGAFKGMGLKAVVIQQYVEPHFDFSNPRKVLEELGFEVVRFANPVHTGYNRYGTPSTSGGNPVPPADEFDELLKSANQFWLISGGSSQLTDAQIEVIVNHWRDGMGMYIWGDNNPFYVDANRVLKAMGMPTMSGNTMGSTYVEPADLATAHHGLVAHPATTGIAKLYEGITIAWFDRDTVAEKSCVELVREHDGHTTVIFREPMGGSGPLMISGCFTQLYCQWDTAGSAAFVRNSAALLAVVNEPVEDPEADAEEKVPELDFTGAPENTCDVGYEESNENAILISLLGDADTFTSDFCLNNPLAFGRGTGQLFAPQLYGWEMAQQLRNLGNNPFTRQPIAAILPLVDLSLGDNRKIVGQALCQIFLGGRAMYQTAWFLYYAACDAMYHQTVDHPDAWRYLLEQIEQTTMTTPTFTELGDKIPLVEAMEQFIGALGYQQQMAQSLGSVLLMLRSLHRLEKVEREARRLAGRRAIIRHLLMSMMGWVKRVATTREMHDWVDSLVFARYHRITLQGTARLATSDELAERMVDGEQSWVNIRRTEAVIGQEFLSSADLTAILEWARQVDSWQISESALLEKLNADTGLAGGVWNGHPATKEEAVEMLESRFVVFTDSSTRPVCLFADASGPDVYRVCGQWVVDQDPATLNLDSITTVTQIKNRRAQILRDTYHTADTNGYPDRQSAHYNLHRAVQVVMTDEAQKSVTEWSPELGHLVADYLMRDGKGNFHDPEIEEKIEVVVESYLEIRAATPVGDRDEVAMGVGLDTKLKRQQAAASARWQAEHAAGQEASSSA